MFESLVGEAKRFQDQRHGKARSNGGARQHEERRPAAVRSEGVVKWYSPAKGYGFIVRAGGGGDVFVHANQLGKAGLPALVEGQRISFEIRMGSKGASAHAIEPL